MANPIVTVIVSQLVAPTPSKRQKTGALISMGGTNLPVGTYKLLTQVSDLTASQQPVIALASITQAAGLATATMASTTISSGIYTAATGLVTLTLSVALNLAPGDAVLISGATGTGSFASINGLQTCGAGTTGTTVTFTIAPNLTMTITGGAIAVTTGLANGAVFQTTIAGATQAGYNGTVTATMVSTSTFTYAVPSGTVTPATGAPTFTAGNQAELLAMATTFFAQGTAQGVYVLELGPTTVALAITALTNFIAANSATSTFAFYSFLVPRNWDAVAGFLTLLASFQTTTAQTYFFVTTTPATYTSYTLAMKDVVALIEAPGLPALEFSMASVFYVTLNYDPSPTNRVTPLNFAFLFGVTPYPSAGNATLLSTWNTANVNVVTTGAQGGVSGNILNGGHTMDGKPYNYWYSVDWTQINVQLQVTAAVIAGSNTPSNPLYYNQAGINVLQQVAVSVMNQGIANGLVLNPVKATRLNAAQWLAAINSLNAPGSFLFAGFSVVNADPFASYVVEAPLDYNIGTYKGISVVYVPLRGFDAIVFNVTVSQFAS